MAVDWGSIAKWGIPAATAATGAYGAYQSSRNARQDRELRQAESEDERQFRQQQLALDESMADPFRHQTDQAGALAYLDMLARAQLDPIQISVPGVKAPQISGGFSYQPNPDLREAATMLQRDVASGRGAPTMTDPANYGMTGAMNLTDPRASGGMGSMPGGGGNMDWMRRAQPRGGTSGAPGSAMDPNDPLLLQLASVPRRGGGTGGTATGALSGAGTGATLGSVIPGVGTAIGAGVGALAGGITGAFKKQAKTAPTDVPMAEAQEIVADAYRTYGGREPEPGEVWRALRGQGSQEGEEYVGEAGLLAVISAIARNNADRMREPTRTSAASSGLFG